MCVIYFHVLLYVSPGVSKEIQDYLHYNHAHADLLQFIKTLEVAWI